MINSSSFHRPADAYHTLYCLSGLSAAQHHIVPSEDRKAELVAAWKDTSTSDEDGTPKLRLLTLLVSHSLFAASSLKEQMQKLAFIDTLSWGEEEGTAKYVGGSANRVVRCFSCFWE